MNFIKKGKNYKGVTFIEVMAVLAIISIFAVISYKSWADNRKHAEVEAAASEIASLINQTRSYALTGKKVSGAVPVCFRIWLEGGGGNQYKQEAYSTNCGSSSSLQSIVTSNFGSKRIKITNDEAYRYSVPNGEGVIEQSTGNIITVESISDTNIKKTVEVNAFRAIVK